MVISAVAVAVAIPADALAALGQPNAHVARHHDKHRKIHNRHGALKGGRGSGGPAGASSDPGDDYPAKWRNAPQDSLFDTWREYNRECTSFAAWALSSRNGFEMPFFDDAKNWGARAQRLGYGVDAYPAVGAVAWSNVGRWGHVAYVQAVNGGDVFIEDYNHRFDGRYDARWVPASTFTGYIHFKDRPSAAPAPTTTPPAGSGNPQSGTVNPQAGTVNPQGGGVNPQGPTNDPQGGTPGQGGQTPPTSPPPPSYTLTVDDRVTNGSSAMREDTPAYLSTVTRNYCKRDGCAIAGTERSSGGTYVNAVCQRQGDRTTNGNDGNTNDDGNPGLFTSARWYGIRLGDGSLGYISEAWIQASQRGGLGLPSC
jgi:surface antigen